jgi:hypothetical protein
MSVRWLTSIRVLSGEAEHGDLFERVVKLKQKLP